MRVYSENKITFISSDGIEFPDIINPVYVYKVGDKITMIDMLTLPESDVEQFRKNYEVTDVRYECQSILVTNQIIVVYMTPEEV